MIKKTLFVLIFILLISLVFADINIANFYNSANDSLGTSTNLTFDQAESNFVYLQVPKNSTVINASMDVSGYLYDVGYEIQEDADSFLCVGSWASCENVHDGSWGSEGLCTLGNICYLYENYTKPSNATISSVWRVYMGSWDRSMTLPLDCWNQEPLQLRIESDNDPIDEYVKARCWDGSSWVQPSVPNQVIEPEVREDQLKWWVSVYPTNLSLDIANNSNIDWSMTGELNSTNSPQNITLNTTAIQNYIDTNNADANGYVYVPLNFTSDTAGIVELSNLDLNVDEPPYNFTFTRANNSNLSQTYYYVNVTYADSNPSACWLEVNQTVNYTMNGSGTTSCNYNVVSPGDGTHNYTIWANDTDNKNGSSGLMFVTLDTTVPSIENITSSVIEDLIFTFSADIGDTLSGVKNASGNLTVGATTRNFTFTQGAGNTWSVSQDPIDNAGNYNGWIISYDNTGNKKETSFTLAVSLKQPSGGGGGSKVTSSAFTKRLNVITSGTMADAIKELKLEAKRFCRVKRQMAAVFAVAGWKTGDYPAPESDISAVLTSPIIDIDDEDIYETSASEVLKAWISSDTVVIARGDLEVDSMAAIAYARVRNVPILLTKPGELPSVTLDAVRRLNTGSFVIVGGEEAVSSEVAEELTGLGSVKRIAGANRQETAVNIAKVLEKLKEIDTIVIADGERLSMDTAIIAAGYDAPVLYVTGDVVPQSTMDFVKAHRVTKNGKEVRLVFADISGYIINYRLDKDF